MENQNRSTTHSLIVLTYTRADLVTARIGELTRIFGSDPNVEIVVFDNGSINLEVKLALSRADGVRVERAKDNLGFGGGWNEAVRRTSSDFIHLISDDVRVYGNFINHITKKSVEKAIKKTAPDVIVNCAAWTDVDGAEDGRRYRKVMDINLRGPANIRQAFDGLLIHISTGFVFDGTNGPNTEDQLAAPVNTYGWSKFGGEQAAMMRQPTIVVRVLDLFGPGPKTDFVRQIRDLLELDAE